MLLGLNYIIWVILVLYFIGMLLMGWYSKRRIKNQEGYLLGNRRFGVGMMVMHAFGAGTHPGDVAGVMSETVTSGASGIWVSWMWMFGTPFYWIIAPIVRRMRCLTVADFFRQRYSQACAVLYVIVASVGMTIAVASVLLATTRTVQGMMGKAGPENEAWFFGILLVSTIVFVIYGYWGGIVAAIRTDMVQGLMIIALSFIAIPAAFNLEQVDSFNNVRATLSAKNQSLLSLFNLPEFNLAVVILLCINAPLSMMAQPHLMTVCGAGKTEWQGRVGFTYGNILKRICTMGWCILGLCWLTYLTLSDQEVHKDAAFGDAVRMLLGPPLQGVMLACVMAAAMSSGDAIQVTVAGLFSENIYRVHINPQADDARVLKVTRISGLIIILAALFFAILMRSSLVKTILDFVNITGLVGISVVMGILWRRMNSTGMVCSTVTAVIAFIITSYVFAMGREFTIGIPLIAGLAAGIVGSLLTDPPSPEVIDPFFKKIYTPIGQEEKLDLPLDQAIPAHKRWLTAGGLFLVKPSRQSWLGFLVTLGICMGCVLTMLLLLNGC
jgi:Na+/proline symporter